MKFSIAKNHGISSSPILLGFLIQGRALINCAKLRDYPSCLKEKINPTKLLDCTKPTPREMKRRLAFRLEVNAEMMSYKNSAVDEQ